MTKEPPGMQKLPVFSHSFWDAREGKLWLQIDKWNTPFFITSRSQWLGSNDVGLDRGQPGKTKVYISKAVARNSARPRK